MALDCVLIYILGTLPRRVLVMYLMCDVLFCVCCVQIGYVCFYPALIRFRLFFRVLFSVVCVCDKTSWSRRRPVYSTRLYLLSQPTEGPSVVEHHAYEVIRMRRALEGRVEG